jgi:hypothetical protein
MSNYIVRNKILITHFTLQVSKTQYSGQNTIQHNENMTYQKKYYRTNWEIYSIQYKMDFKEYHGKVFPKSRDGFCYLFEVNVSEF